MDGKQKKRSVGEKIRKGLHVKNLKRKENVEKKISVKIAK